MATVYSVQKTKWSQTEPSLLVTPAESRGRVRQDYALYEATALPIGSVIEMFNIPNGARIVSMELVHDALGAGTTLSVGNAAYNTSAGVAVALSAVSYQAAAASAAIATVGAAATSALGRNTTVDVDGTGLPVSVTLAGGAATGTVELTCSWVLD